LESIELGWKTIPEFGARHPNGLLLAGQTTALNYTRFYLGGCIEPGWKKRRVWLEDLSKLVGKKAVVGWKILIEAGWMSYRTRLEETSSLVGNKTYLSNVVSTDYKMPRVYIVVSQDCISIVFSQLTSINNASATNSISKARQGQTTEHTCIDVYACCCRLDPIRKKSLTNGVFWSSRHQT
jgi:hypothetical protein